MRSTMPKWSRRLAIASLGTALLVTINPIAASAQTVTYIDLDGYRVAGLKTVTDAIADVADGARSAVDGDRATASAHFTDLAAEARALATYVHPTQIDTVPAARALESLAERLAADPTLLNAEASNLYGATALVGSLALRGTCDTSVVNDVPYACQSIDMTGSDVNTCIAAPETNCVRNSFLEMLTADISAIIDDALARSTQLGPNNAYDVDCPDDGIAEGDPDGTVCEYVQPSNVILDGTEATRSTQSTGIYGCNGKITNVYHRASDNTIRSDASFACDDYWNYWSGEARVQRKVCGSWGCGYDTFGTRFKTQNDGAWGYENDRGTAWMYCKTGTHRYRWEMSVVVTPRNRNYRQYHVYGKQDPGVQFTCPRTSFNIDHSAIDALVGDLGQADVTFPEDGS